MIQVVVFFLNNPSHQFLSADAFQSLEATGKDFPSSSSSNPNQFSIQLEMIKPNTPKNRSRPSIGFPYPTANWTVNRSQPVKARHPHQAVAQTGPVRHQDPLQGACAADLWLPGRTNLIIFTTLKNGDDSPYTGNLP